MRALRTLLIIVVILGGLFVGADRIAVHVAENEAADRIRSSEGLTASPDVDIKGFPFLTQVLGKKLDRVDITMNGVEASAQGRKVRITRVRAELHDVRISGSYSSAVAARASGTAHISYEDLTRASETGAKVAYGGDGKVKVTGSVDILGRTLTRSVTSSVTMVGKNRIKVRADAVPGEGIPGLEGLVRKKTDFEGAIGGLPSGLELDKVQATPDGVDIGVTGTDVSLAG
ncbi:LmeA family phospholipid-binding protein [Streptomyces sp. NBC_00344]|uniref:LmeA family phospholipid-binding protein n=1 Tax=Streptomyces sp. NBC_00344 TaxID=2975720 RepID=UPI002E1FBC5A